MTEKKDCLNVSGGIKERSGVEGGRSQEEQRNNFA